MGKKGSGENIRVVVRVRPLNSVEREKKCKEAVVLDLGASTVTVQSSTGEPNRWTFDAVYNNQFSQKNIYDQEVAPLVTSVLTGYNATVFAYGQSGSGKTHTMTGDPTNDELKGVMPNSIEHIFSQVDKLSSPGKQYNVRVSHLELYNGKVRDLFSPDDKELQIKQGPAKNFFVQGLSDQKVTDVATTLRLFDESMERRKTGVTDLNAHSSRSHSIFTIHIEIIDSEVDPGSEQRMQTKLNLVDLAGSERQGKTGATGSTLKEGCNINLSLSALGTVIDNIVKGQGHIPYRSTGLTMLLKDSLGGNSKTVMFANCGPADRNTSESISTLRFADRAKQIQNKPVKNLDPKDAKIQSLLDRIADLEKRLGGEGHDIETNDELLEKNEQLQAEIENYKDANEKLQAEIEEVGKLKDQEIEQLKAEVQKLEDKLKDLKEVQEHQGSANDEVNNEVNEIKRYMMEFIKSSTTDQELQGINKKRHIPEEVAGKMGDPSMAADVGTGQVVLVLDGIREMYNSIRKNTITEETVQKVLHEQSSEFESKFNAYRRQQEQEKQGLADAKKSLQEKVDNLAREASAAQVELEKARKEAEKAKSKTEKEKKKMTEKFQKLAEEFTTASDAFEKEKSDWAEQKRSESAKEEAAVKEMKKNFEVEREKFQKEFKAAQSEWEEEKKNILKKNEEQGFEAQQLATQVEQLETSMRQAGPRAAARAAAIMGKSTGEEKEVEPVPAALNEGMIAEEDEAPTRLMLEEVQKQARIHAHLQAIRHHQQLHLEQLLKEHSERQAKQAACDEEAIQKIREECNQKLEAAEREKQELASKQEKEQDKMLKKVNKKVTEFSQMETAWQEEKAQMEEERKELTENNETYLKLNQELETEIDTLQRKVANMKDREAQDEQHFRSQLEALRSDLSEAHDRVIAADKKLAELDEVKKERDTIADEKDNADRMVQEKTLQLENNRQMWKWCNTLLEKEKKLTEELKEEIKGEKARTGELEEHWRRTATENTNKLVAINNRKLQEQAVRNQELMAEEEERTKQVKDKLRKAKRSIEKEKNKFDSLVLQYEDLQKQFEEFKVSSMRIHLEKEQLEVVDSNFQISESIQKARQQAKARQVGL